MNTLLNKSHSILNQIHSLSIQSKFQAFSNLTKKKIQFKLTFDDQMAASIFIFNFKHPLIVCAANLWIKRKRNAETLEQGIINLN